MRLYEITAAYRALSDAIAQCDEVPDDLEQQLSRIEAALDDKVDGCAALKREYEAEAKAAKAESDRLIELARVRQNAADRIWKYLSGEFAKMDIKRHQTSRFHVYCQMSPPSAKFEGDAAKLPPELRKVEYKLNGKEAIARWKAWKAANDEKLPCPLPVGVEVTQNVSLRCK